MRTIFALFESPDEAEAAVAELIDRRFDDGEMDVIVRDPATDGSGRPCQGDEPARPKKNACRR